VKKVAVVILNWNGEKLLKEFLPSVVAYSPEAEIIIADNASDDGSLAFLKSNFPSLRIIQNPSNLGFAGGYNLALKEIEADLYVLLNSDIEVTEDWLKPLLKVMDDNSVAGCQPKILSFHNKNHFEHAGASGGFLDKDYFPFCRGRIFDHFEEDLGQYNDEREIFWATGAALMIRADVFHSVKGFDEYFFAHMEEIDLCWRIKKMGYKFKVVPSSVIYHLGGGTLPYSSPRKVYLNFRNSLMMLIKNHRGLLLPKLFWRLCLDGVAAFRFLFRGEFGHFWAVFKAHLYQYKHLGRLLKLRKIIRKTAQNENDSGIFSGSILWNYYLKGVREFTALNQLKFKK
jgi:GT2 family glycosyltransferase